MKHGTTGIHRRARVLDMTCLIRTGGKRYAFFPVAPPTLQVMDRFDGGTA